MNPDQSSKKFNVYHHQLEKTPTLLGGKENWSDHFKTQFNTV